MNYHNKIFKVYANSDNGSTSSATTFFYHQEKNVVSAHYQGGKIIKGHLIGLVDEQGVIDMRYHQIEVDGYIKTGKCKSTPEILDDGRIRLHESWEWTSGDFSKGNSIIEEVTVNEG